MELFYVRLPKDSRVVILEDSPMRIAWFQKRVPDLVACKTVDEFFNYFDQGAQRCDFIFWDHDLGKDQPNGEVAAKRFTERYGAGNKYALIHSWNIAGARRMQDIMNGVIHVPFGQFEIEVES